MNDQDKVEELDLGISPDAGISGPLLLQDDYAAFLTFNAVRPNVDGRMEPAGTAVVEIVGCSTTKFRYPNDEALPGHPLYSKGLSYYSTFEVRQSSWVADKAAQNRVSFPNYTRSGLRHFVFTFHDSTFECLADDIKIEVSQEPYSQIFQRLTERILHGEV